jgi:hypothetical protein
MELMINRFRIFDLRYSEGSDEAELWGGEEGSVQCVEFSVQRTAFRRSEKKEW